MDGYVIRIGEKESDDINIKDVTIYDHKDGLGNINVTIAKTGRMESTPDGRFMIFTLFNGHDYKERVDESGHRKNRPFERSTFTEKYIKFDLGDFEMSHVDENLLKKHYLMLNIKQLNISVDSMNLVQEEKDYNFANSFKSNFSVYYKIDSIAFTQKDTTIVKDLLTELNDFSKENLLRNASTSAQSISNTIKFAMDEKEIPEENIRKFIITIHEKFTLSFACLILFFIGAPMGAIIRKGGLGFPVVISVIFFIIFHIASITGKKYVIAGVLIPEIGMWLASALLLPIGIFLTYKATNDAPVLDADNYRKLFRSITNLIHKAD